MHNGYRYIDADAHYLEPEDMWERYLDKEFRSEMPRSKCGYWHTKLAPPEDREPGAQPFVPGEAHDPLAYVDDIYVGAYAMPEFLVGRCAPVPDLGESYGKYAEMGFGPEAYQDFLDTSGIDYIVLYPTTGLYVAGVPTLSAETAAAYRRATNRWQHDFCTEVGTGAVGIAGIDLRDPVEAAREVSHCVNKYGFRGAFTVPQPVTKFPLFHRFYDPLWAELQDLDVPIGFHPTAGSFLPEPGDSVLWGWPGGRGVTTFVLDSMLVSIQLIAGGVLERFPKLRVAHLEIGAGWVPYWMDRMQSGIQGGNRRLGTTSMPQLSMHPLEYFQRQCYTGADPDDPGIKPMVEAMGDNNIVAATDFGHPEGRYHVDAVEQTLALDGLSTDTKRKVMWDNPARLYGIGA